jgi:hypothetical protein
LWPPHYFFQNGFAIFGIRAHQHDATLAVAAHKPKGASQVVGTTGVAGVPPRLGGQADGSRVLAPNWIV